MSVHTEEPNKDSGRHDLPIETLNNDRLSIKPYIDGLVNFIQETETPLVIGLQGAWGTGKTSFMRLIEREIKNKSSISRTLFAYSVFIDTWKYSQVESKQHVNLSVVIDFYEEISKLRSSGTLQKWVKAVLSKDTWEGVWEGVKVIVGHIKSYGKDRLSLLSGGSSVILPSTENCWVLLGALALPRSLVDANMRIKLVHEAVRKKIESIVKNDPSKKIVIFIDNLDRLDAIQTVRILEALSILMSVKGCVFILAVDTERLHNVMEKIYGNKLRSEFFDKIIHVSFHMPVTMYNYGKYFNDLFKFLNLESFPEAQTLALAAVGQNLRTLKQLANTCNLAGHINKKQREQHTQETQGSADTETPYLDRLNTIKHVEFIAHCFSAGFHDLYILLQKENFEALINIMNDLNTFAESYNNNIFPTDPIYAEVIKNICDNNSSTVNRLKFFIKNAYALLYKDVRGINEFYNILTLSKYKSTSAQDRTREESVRYILAEATRNLSRHCQLENEQVSSAVSPDGRVATLTCTLLGPARFQIQWYYAETMLNWRCTDLADYNSLFFSKKLRDWLWDKRDFFSANSGWNKIPSGFTAVRMFSDGIDEATASATFREYITSDIMSLQKLLEGFLQPDKLKEAKKLNTRNTTFLENLHSLFCEEDWKIISNSWNRLEQWSPLRITKSSWSNKFSIAIESTKPFVGGDLIVGIRRNAPRVDDSTPQDEQVKKLCTQWIVPFFKDHIISTDEDAYIDNKDALNSDRLFMKYDTNCYRNTWYECFCLKKDYGWTEMVFLDSAFNVKGTNDDALINTLKPFKNINILNALDDLAKLYSGGN